MKIVKQVSPYRDREKIKQSFEKC